MELLNPNGMQILIISINENSIIYNRSEKKNI
ncbi:hypothetical protein QFZ37_003333 [Chryseobacterium ginsenosidimutans]|nr:hypothetical protein [Chryseobacterium ginsenosidimutans]